MTVRKLFAIGLLMVGSLPAWCGSRLATPPDARVVVHVSLSTGAPADMVLVEADNRRILYVKYADSRVDVIDMRDPSSPQVIRSFNIPVSSVLETVSFSDRPNVQAAQSDTLREIPTWDMAGGGQLQSVKEFGEVKAVIDRGSGLYYVLGSEGLWVVQFRLPLRFVDPSLYGG